ncbi:MAG: hypothetical protein K8T89_10280 [Planctomycetes bacterium]|nr:hypothetical protein [Planctomycetota bacterium]
MRIVGSIALFLVLSSFASGADEPKGTVVKLDGLSSTTPADWKSEKPLTRLRSYQFRLPGSKGSTDAEVYIFPNLTNTVPQNFTRYKEMFVPPEGKSVEDISKEAQIKVGKSTVDVLDVEGTWLYKERPFDPKSKQETRPNSRVIFVIFSNDDGTYLIRLSGPAATVTAHAKPFYDWIKAFK